MTKTHLLALMILPVLASCASIAPLVTTRRLSWEMVQSVGGIRVGDPVTNPDNTVFLPVYCNVSGTEAITVEPTGISSALVVKKVKATIQGSRIGIQVVTSIVNGRNTASSTGVNLGVAKAGAYQVDYQNSDGTAVSLRSVVIKRPGS